MKTRFPTGALATLLLTALGSLGLSAQTVTPLTTVTSDGVTIYGEQYFGELGEASPLILLFHQGGSSGRGEYAEIASWLNSEGFRAIAWDQRAGGDRHGEANRTVDGLDPTVPAEYCDAYPDLQAALDYVTSMELAEQVTVWGSSYSAALVFRLAATNPESVTGVLAFSPSAGGPLERCLAREWIGTVSVPVSVYRPRSEMALASSIEQREILSSAGADFEIVEDGVHGSSMLLDSRTGHDMAAARRSVLGWLMSLPSASAAQESGNAADL